jgi:signal transduction histidine kinase
MSIASVVLATMVGVGFGVLLVTIDDLRGAAQRATHARDELADAVRLQNLVVDLETGQRGFVITRQERFLQPWSAARAAFPATARQLVRAVEDPQQAVLARRIVWQIREYLRDYSEPLVRAARRSESRARSLMVTEEGRRRVDGLRAGFDRFEATERPILAQRLRSDNATARRAVVAASVGLAGSIFVLLLCGVYLTRAIAVPVRRTARMARTLASGDLAVRLPEKSTAEIGDLERAFNELGTSLEDGREELGRLADEQSALRRVATLVAHGVPASRLFETVTREVGQSVGADLARMERYESDGTVTALAAWSREPGVRPAVDRRFALEGTSIAAEVRRTGRPARVDSFDGATGPIAEEARELGIVSSVGCPIVVGGGVWGVIAASARSREPFAPGTEARIAEFTELVASAVANAEARAEVAASRARILTAADDARRRVVRDLHDGAQQHLVHAIVTLKLARQALLRGEDAVPLVAEALGHTEQGNTGLRELAHGILPSVLTRGGLRAGVNALASRVPLTVTVDVPPDRYQPQIEASAYFVVAEALTNTVKHAHARHADVTAWRENGTLHIDVRDDGVGGARHDGNGLIGLEDRMAAVGGELRVESPRGGGTLVAARLPLPR